MSFYFRRKKVHSNIWWSYFMLYHSHVSNSTVAATAHWFWYSYRQQKQVKHKHSIFDFNRMNCLSHFTSLIFLWSCLNACQNICTGIFNILQPIGIIVLLFNQFHVVGKKYTRQSQRIIIIWTMWEKKRLWEVPSLITVRHTE